MGFGESAGGPAGRDARWRCTGLEFQVLWRELGRDRLPYPLCFRPAADDQDDLDRQRRAAAQHWAPRVTERLHHHLTVLAEPDIRLEVVGFAGVGFATRIRMHAGLHSSGATLAIQLPGVDADTGGDVLIRGVSPAQIPQAVAAALPAAPAGSRGALRFRRRDLDASAGPLLVSAGAGRVRDEALALLRRPRTGIGEVTAFAGVAYDSRPTTDGIGLHWLDFDGDGRYTMRESDDVVVAPAATTDLAGEIQRLVDAIRTRVPVR